MCVCAYVCVWGGGRGPSVLHIARFGSDLTCNCTCNSVFKTVLWYCVVFHYVVLCIRCNMYLY